MISLDDFTDAAGKADWKAYHAAEVEAGERCRQCGTYVVVLARIGKGPQRCPGCEFLATDPGVRTHETLVRCPHCRGTQNASDEEDICEDGEHTILCDHCEKEYEVGTAVSFTFTSPPLKSEADGEKDNR